MDMSGIASAPGMDPVWFFDSEEVTFNHGVLRAGANIVF